MVQLHGWLCTVSADKRRVDPAGAGQTFCSDEFFVQTLIVQSPYQDKIYQGPGDTSARAIDWDRGNPWVWKYADLEQLKASPCMFARKFDIEKEPELVHEIERLYAPHI